MTLRTRAASASPVADLRPVILLGQFHHCLQHKQTFDGVQAFPPLYDAAA